MHDDGDTEDEDNYSNLLALADCYSKDITVDPKGPDEVDADGLKVQSVHQALQRGSKRKVRVNGGEEGREKNKKRARRETYDIARVYEPAQPTVTRLGRSVVPPAQIVPTMNGSKSYGTTIERRLRSQMLVPPEQRNMQRRQRKNRGDAQIEHPYHEPLLGPDRQTSVLPWEMDGTRLDLVSRLPEFLSSYAECFFAAQWSAGDEEPLGRPGEQAEAERGGGAGHSLPMSFNEYLHLARALLFPIGTIFAAAVPRDAVDTEIKASELGSDMEDVRAGNNDKVLIPHYAMQFEKGARVEHDWKQTDNWFPAIITSEGATAGTYDIQYQEDHKNKVFITFDVNERWLRLLSPPQPSTISDVGSSSSSSSTTSSSTSTSTSTSDSDCPQIADPPIQFVCSTSSVDAIQRRVTVYTGFTSLELPLEQCISFVQEDVLAQVWRDSRGDGAAALAAIQRLALDRRAAQWCPEEVNLYFDLRKDPEIQDNARRIWQQMKTRQSLKEVLDFHQRFFPFKIETRSSQLRRKQLLHVFKRADRLRRDEANAPSGGSPRRLSQQEESQGGRSGERGEDELERGGREHDGGLAEEEEEEDEAEDYQDSQGHGFYTPETYIQRAVNVDMKIDGGLSPGRPAPLLVRPAAARRIVSDAADVLAAAAPNALNV